MKQLLKILFLCASMVTLVGIAPILVRADNANTPQSSEYLFHLYLNTTNQLVTDRSFKFSYDIISDTFVQPPVGQFPYHGEIISFTGASAANFKFDVHQGKVSVYAPYVADAQKVVFYDSQNQAILTVPVSDSSFCNDDGICNADRGEDSLSCPKDCKQSLSAPPSASPVPTTPANSSGLVSGIIYTIIGLVLLGGLWWFFKRGRGPSGPTFPSSLPTPPTPATPNNPV